jgi:hypothetical protein
MITKLSRLDLDLLHALARVDHSAEKLDSFLDEGMQLVEMKDPLPVIISTWQDEVQSRYSSLRSAWSELHFVLHNFDDEKRYIADKRCTLIAVEVCIKMQRTTAIFWGCSNRLDIIRGELQAKLKLISSVPDSMVWKLKPGRAEDITSIPCPNCHELASMHYGRLYCHNCQTPVRIGFAS